MKQMPITRRALTQRLNRVLRRKNQRLVSREGRPTDKRGRFTLVDLKRDTVIREIRSLSALARELKVIERFEVLVS